MFVKILLSFTNMATFVSMKDITQNNRNVNLVRLWQIGTRTGTTTGTATVKGTGTTTGRATVKGTGTAAVTALTAAVVK